MPGDALDSEYENGIADILGYLARDSAVVERNVHLFGRDSHQQRQIDVMVTGKLFGLDSATMIVDCKRYKSPIDVNHVGTFVALVEDVGADIGLLVTTAGASKAARQLAENVRGVRVSMLAVDELDRWSPPGTVHFDYAVPEGLHAEAARVARRTGFRAKTIEVPEWRNLPGHASLQVFRHFGVVSPTPEAQLSALGKLLEAFKVAGIVDPLQMGNGVVAGGGTPSHRWLEITIDGRPTGHKILAASEEEIDLQLTNAQWAFGSVAKEQMDVLRPDPWPIPALFPSWV
jgi:Restriction endonuclease.